MSRCTLRYLFTVLIYAAVAIVFVPYLTGHTTTGLIYLAGGIGAAIVFAIARCCFMEGDCTERTWTGISGNAHSQTAPHSSPR
jgi:hypothetical protein